MLYILFTAKDGVERHVVALAVVAYIAVITESWQNLRIDQFCFVGL